MQVQSLALLSESGIWPCHELWYRSQTWLGSLSPWLWRRLAVTAQIQPLAWEPPYALDVALKRKKKRILVLHVIYILINFLWLHLWHIEVP